MKTILFQGDSITDCNRGSGFGGGYPRFVAARLGFEEPGAYEFINKGVSGNRVVDLYARIKKDFINLKPDYLSILIGVNDVWHDLSWQNGVDAEKYEKIYCMLIEELKEALPGVKIMILEPFCLRAEATDNTEEQPDRWEWFSSEVALRARKARAVAEKYGLLFVPLQAKFDEAAKTADNAYWLADGVHPTMAGHELITREWLRAFEQMK